MSVLIKGMNIPPSCFDCDMLELSGPVMCEHAYDTKNSIWGRALNCPLIEIPDHGDLIDRDALMEHGCYLPLPLGNLPVIYRSYVENAHVVIPAERS